MQRNQFEHFREKLLHYGKAGVISGEFDLGHDGVYRLQYIPFEHVNTEARLVIVGITPGPTQLELAYETAQRLLQAGMPTSKILLEVKRIGAFGGKAMRPNLLKMLRYFRFDHLLGIKDVASLWGENAHLLHSTSVVPHAAFKSGKMFAGTFTEVIESNLLRECFNDCFVSTVREINSEAYFVGLGPCPREALDWCVQKGCLRRDQVLGAFCHPSSQGGSKTRYFLRELRREDLNPADPTRFQTQWLDAAYKEMYESMTRLGVTPHNGMALTDTARSKTPLAMKTAIAEKSLRMQNHRETGDKLEIIYAEIEKAGYRMTKRTKYVGEFKIPGYDEVIYLKNTTTNLNGIEIVVHPDLKPAWLQSLDGVESIGNTVYFNSNMTRFPRRKNRGESETPFGWQVNIPGLTALRRFLAALQVRF